MLGPDRDLLRALKSESSSIEDLGLRCFKRLRLHRDLYLLRLIGVSVVVDSGFP